MTRELAVAEGVPIAERVVPSRTRRANSTLPRMPALAVQQLATDATIGAAVLAQRTCRANIHVEAHAQSDPEVLIGDGAVAFLARQEDPPGARTACPTQGKPTSLIEVGE